MNDPRSTVHCPKCGRFVGRVRAILTWRGGGGIRRVEAVCKVHGRVRHPIRMVDGEDVGWDWEDFEHPEER